MEGGVGNSFHNSQHSMCNNLENNGIIPNYWPQYQSNPQLEDHSSWFSLFGSDNQDHNINLVNQSFEHTGLPVFQPNDVFSGFHESNESITLDEIVHLDDNNNNQHDDQGLHHSNFNIPFQRKVGGSIWIKGQWTYEEDDKLMELVDHYGVRKWAQVAKHMEGRIGKQCRERWQNHLRPDIKKDHWSEEEERLLIEVHEKVGNKWAEIAKFIPGRTENSIKNHWNATKRKQTSKRKIVKKQTSLNGGKPSFVLEEYIKKKYFDEGSSSSNSSGKILVPDEDHESISYLTTFQGYEEEMDFMKNLFSNTTEINASLSNPNMEQFGTRRITEWH